MMGRRAKPSARALSTQEARGAVAHEPHAQFYRVRDRSTADEPLVSPEEALPGAIVRRFLLRAGFQSSSTRAERDAREFLCAFLRKLAGGMLALAQHDRRAGFRLHDVLRACAHFGVTLYGYDDLVVLPSPDKRGQDEVFHVTELVECATTFSRAQQQQQQQQQSEEPDLEPARNRRFQRMDFVTNYATWERDDADDCSDPELSDWSCFSDSEMESEEGEGDAQEDSPRPQHAAAPSPSTAARVVRPWQRGEADEDKFLSSLESAQQLVDTELLVVAENNEPETEEMEADAPLGQGYFSDCDGNEESVADWGDGADEGRLWSSSGDDHDVDTCATPIATAFEDDGNQYVMPRSSFAALFRAVVRESLRVGGLSVTAVALSALHNASEQYLHRALSEEGSLRYRLQAVLMERAFERATTHLETQLQAERDKVTALEDALGTLRAALTAREREVQQLRAQGPRQVATPSKRTSCADGSDVEMTTPTPKKRKKSPAKQRKVSSSASAQAVRKAKAPAKGSRSAQALVGSLRSRLQDLPRAKTTRVNPA